MSEENKKYQEIIEDLKQHITDEKELEYVTKKFAEAAVIFLNIIDEISDNFDERLQQLEEKQALVEGKLKNIQSIIRNIESDIYEDELNFDILCPYCDNEFSTIVENDSQKEVKCPECNNTIELDWNDDSDECGCSSCTCDDESSCGDCNCQN